MALTCHIPEEGPRVHSVNDFVVFNAMVIGSCVSGSLLDRSPEDFLIIAGLFAVSVIFYAAHGKFSPTFQKL